MDVRRTWEERAPGRKLARLKHLIAEYSQAEGSNLQIHFRDRTVKNNEELVAFLGDNSAVVWTENADTLLNAGRKEMICQLVAGLA